MRGDRGRRADHQRPDPRDWDDADDGAAPRAGRRGGRRRRAAGSQPLEAKAPADRRREADDRLARLLAEVRRTTPRPLEPSRSRSCDGKNAYTERAAREVARAARRRPGGATVEAYACRFCSAFHVGHHPGRPAGSAAAGAPQTHPGAPPCRS